MIIFNNTSLTKREFFDYFNVVIVFLFSLFSFHSSLNPHAFFIIGLLILILSLILKSSVIKIDKPPLLFLCQCIVLCHFFINFFL